MAEFILKVSDTFNIENPLEIDTDYKIESIVNVESIEKKSDQEGGFNYVHKVKFTDAINLIQGIKKIKTKDKRKWTQKLRDVLFIKDVEYDSFMPWLFAVKLDELIDEYNATHTTQNP